MTKKNPNYTGRPRGLLAKDTTESWINKASAKYGNKFDYSLVEYVNSHTPVKIICPTHGEFCVRPGNHLNQAPCWQCGIDSKRLTSEEFKKRLQDNYGDTLDFSKTEYIGGRGTRKTLIGCPIHGFVKTSEAALIKGCGCPECSTNGYRDNKPGSLYVLGFENITKIGITNITAKRRIKDIVSSSKKQFVILDEFNFKDGNIPRIIENLLLDDLRKIHTSPDESFDGYTECFYDVDRTILISNINKLCSEYSTLI